MRSLPLVDTRIRCCACGSSWASHPQALHPLPRRPQSVVCRVLPRLPASDNGRLVNSAVGAARAGSALYPRPGLDLPHGLAGRVRWPARVTLAGHVRHTRRVPNGSPPPSAVSMLRRQRRTPAPQQLAVTGVRAGTSAACRARNRAWTTCPRAAGWFPPRPVTSCRRHDRTAATSGMPSTR